MKKFKVELKLTEEMLGTASNNPHIHEDFIAAKAGDPDKTSEEVEAISAEEKIEESKTVFPRNVDGDPIMWDYQLKGFFKDATGVLRTVKGTLSSKIKAYKKYIDGRVFVEPRQIKIGANPYNDGQIIKSCQRPLRGQTPQGERIALANSETINAGSKISFELLLLADEDEEWIKELLNYGKLRGLGQWRNSGKGRFDVVKIEEVKE